MRAKYERDAVAMFLLQNLLFRKILHRLTSKDYGKIQGAYIEKL